MNHLLKILLRSLGETGALSAHTEPQHGYDGIGVTPEVLLVGLSGSGKIALLLADHAEVEEGGVEGVVGLDGAVEPLLGSRGIPEAVGSERGVVGADAGEPRIVGIRDGAKRLQCLIESLQFQQSDPAVEPGFERSAVRLQGSIKIRQRALSIAGQKLRDTSKVGGIRARAALALDRRERLDRARVVANGQVIGSGGTELLGAGSCGRDGRIGSGSGQQEREEGGKNQAAPRT